MGQIFDLIADSALVKLDDYYTECHVCERADVDLYHYDGKLHNANEETEDVYAVCAECIKTAALTHTAGFEYLRTIDHYLENISESKDQLQNELVQKYQHTPNIPIFMQYEDRPLCCNAITEFTGHPHDKEELYKISEIYIYWEKEIKSKPALYNFRQYGEPESYNDIAAFNCPNCGSNYFVFQFS
jgi:hypothetical protein